MNVALIVALSAEVRIGLRDAGMPEPVRGTNGHHAETDAIEAVVGLLLSTDYPDAEVDTRAARRLVDRAVEVMVGQRQATVPHTQPAGG